MRQNARVSTDLFRGREICGKLLPRATRSQHNNLMVIRHVVYLDKVWSDPKTPRSIAAVKDMALLVTRMWALDAAPMGRSMTARTASHAILQRLQPVQMARS